VRFFSRERLEFSSKKAQQLFDWLEAAACGGGWIAKVGSSCWMVSISEILIVSLLLSGVSSRGFSPSLDFRRIISFLSSRMSLTFGSSLTVGWVEFKRN